MLKVDRLVRTAGRIGFDGVLASLARRPGLLVLAYHRIGEADGQFFDDELFSATADGFRDQLRYLARHFSVLDASAVLKAMRGGRLELDTPSALVTFDDGYRDNCEVALPILRELGLPAVFFIAAGYVDSPRLTWWDRVAYIVKRTERPSLALTYPEPLTIDVRTELTGKKSQAGSLDELLAWSTAVPGVYPCIDFSHQYARELGTHNTYEHFAATLTAIEHKLGRAALERLHVHISGIQYGPKGERKHEPLLETAFNWKDLLRALKDLNVSGWVVSESPEMEDDALLLQQTYRRLQ